MTIIPSGMSNMQQMQDSIATFSEKKSLNEKEMELILGVAGDMIDRTTVPCTGRHYCVSYCPQKLDIPFLLKLYNEAVVAGFGDFIAPMGLSSIDADKQPECCVACHSCEKVCPQTIRIPDMLSRFAERLGRG